MLICVPYFCRLALLVVSIAVALAAQASAQDVGSEFTNVGTEFTSPVPESPDFALSIGYASIGIGEGVLASEEALRFDAALSTAALPNVPQLRVGVAFGTALVLDGSGRAFSTNQGVLITGSADIPLMLLEPEVRLSWRQYLGASQTFYLEPGIAGGGVFANLSLDADQGGNGESFDEWESAFSARVFLNIGFEVSGGMAGLQASYMRGGDIDFAPEASGEVDEVYVGIFGAIRF